MMACVFAPYSHAQVWLFSKKQRQQLALQTDTVQYKFPLIKAADSMWLDTATVMHRTKYLNAFNEPALFLDDSNDQAVRFTWLRSKDRPVIIRLVLHNNHAIVYWKECDGMGTDAPCKLIITGHKELSASAWHDFRRLALKVNNCTVDLNNNADPGKTSEWVLEAKMGNMYILMKKNSPSSVSDVYKSCNYLIGLTDLVIPDADKY